MSTSLLYHMFGIEGCHYRRAFFEGGKVIFAVEQDRHRLRCIECGYWRLTLKGYVSREFQEVPAGRKRIVIRMNVHRVLCEECGALRQVRVPFADPHQRHTRNFERYVLFLCRYATMQDVALHLGVSWDVIKDIVKRDLKKRFKAPKLSHLRWIAIDEIAVKKGHNYLTVVQDLLSGEVVFVGDGKGGDALAPFWKRLSLTKAKIEAVAMDMSPAYIQAVIKNLPDAQIVFDHFHIVQMFNELLSDLRRDLFHEADQLGQSLLKGIRWLLLKNPENLDDDKKERERLEKALRFNQPLAEAYYMKEQLRLLWDQPDATTAERFLDRWILWAEQSGIKILKKMANMLGTHRYGLLSWFDYPISTGPLEGTNNKIKTMKRKAYGFRDMEFFKLKILALHETKYALVG